MSSEHTYDLHTKYHIMLDIETLGTEPGAAIVSIGAVFFDAAKYAKFGASYYERIDVTSCIKADLHMNAATIAWWMQQSDGAREQLFAQPRTSLTEACTNFSAWALAAGGTQPIEPKDIIVWSNGTNFDMPILKAAFKSAGVAWPFLYYQELCYRTLKWLMPEAMLGEPRALAGAREDKQQLTLNLDGELTPHGSTVYDDSLLATVAGLPEHHALRDAVDQALRATQALHALERRT